MVVISSGDARVSFWRNSCILLVWSGRKRNPDGLREGLVKKNLSTPKYSAYIKKVQDKLKKKQTKAKKQQLAAKAKPVSP